MTEEELKKILEDHELWLETSGKKGMRAELRRANLERADLYGANLDKQEQHRLGIILDKKIIGYKKCLNNVIVKLEIPKGAIVFCINGSKCRTNKVKCIDVIGGNIARSIYSNDFTYEKGKIYTIKDFNLIYNIECANGIHFFKTLKEAEEYTT